MIKIDRDKKIIKISVSGIVVNVFLVFFKAIVGLLSNSIAIILDAVNNLSDALSSIITIIGTVLSGKKPNKKHPYGYGRIEYFSSVIIAVIIMIAGLTSIKESVEKIIHPDGTNYSKMTLIVIIVAVLVKFFFGKYVKKQGEKLKSGSLIASGSDAVSDAFLSFSTFVAAIVNILFKISLEGYLGVIISLIILRSSIKLLGETLDEIIGRRADTNLIEQLQKKILSYDKVLGVYDMTLHNYGPNKNIATAHIQVDDEMKAKEIHRLTRKIMIDVYTELGIIVTLGIYASNDDDEYKKLKKYINDLIAENESIIQMHGFYVDEDAKAVSFDVIFNFEEENVNQIVNDMKLKLKEKFPKYDYSVIVDTDYSVIVEENKNKNHR